MSTIAALWSRLYATGTALASISTWPLLTMVPAGAAILSFILLLALWTHKTDALRPWWQALRTPESLTILSQSSKASLESSLQWWEDLAPPFAFATDDEPEQEPDWRPHEAVDVVHFCFLVHGYRGYSRDLSYLATVMQRVADTELKRRMVGGEDSPLNEGSLSSSSVMVSTGDMSSVSSSASSSSSTLQQDVVVYTPTCNERRTDDGVISGGDRLVEEMRQVIDKEMQRRQNSKKDTEEDSDEFPRITISMLGNSLGGLYSRYAIAKLLQHCEVEEVSPTNTDSPTWILDGKYRLSFNIFCTTATPHLGVAGHTFLPIPRTAEVGVAQVMRSTGRDLFRCNDLLKRMATAPEFLQPLGHFRQRIAYANAYSTDFPVHCKTAGFLSDDSDSPHYFCPPQEAEHDSSDDSAEADGLIIAKVYTPRRALSESPGTTESSKDILDSDEREMDESLAWEIEHDKEDELKVMSQSLDTLGWKKIFVDARKNMPKIPLFGLSSRSNSTIMEEDSSSSEDFDENNVEDDRQARTDHIELLRQKGVVESKHLASAVTAPLFDEHFHWPVGHNMMVAFSRSRLSTYLNKAGRPVVDSIAKNLVREMLDWPVDQTAANAREKLAA